MPSSLHICADENIPHVHDAFGALGTVQTRPGRAMKQRDLQETDVLLVRSVTSVGPALLEGTPVQFVGSATIGTDHVDRAYLDANDIAFAHAPASNADSVADYVVAALLRLATRRGVALEGRTVGTVGCGNIGGRLARRLPALGVDVLVNDPPRAEAMETRGEAHDFVSLDTVLDASDILTLHVPLTTDGPHPTHHLVGRPEIEHLSDDAWLVNTSRGAVVNNDVLGEAMHHDRLGGAILDVWEHEPTPDVDLLRMVDIATPHIAGYAYDGKVRGTTMLYEALCQHLGESATWDPQSVLAPSDADTLRCTPPDPRLPQTDWAQHLAAQVYPIVEDDARLRAIADEPPDERGAFFSNLRKTYPIRREMRTHTVPRSAVPDALRSLVHDGLTLTLDGRQAADNGW
jgi:erythronate-4-phosphate dehydrogenase